MKIVNALETLKPVLPLLVMGAGLLIGSWLFMNPPEAKKRPNGETAIQLVEVAAAEKGTYTARVEGMGQVVPAWEAELKAQVAGEIIDASPEFMPGGRFKKDDIVLTLDFQDYMLEKQAQEAALKQAEAALQMEEGRQKVAQNEMKILSRTTGRELENPALALRRPQMAQARAEMEKAKAALARAELNLERTAVRAPFNAILTKRFVSLGGKVTAQEPIAVLAGTDEYWVNLSVPVSDLKWLMQEDGEPMTGTTAHVVMDGGRGQRDGYLLRLTGTLDAASRLAGLVVAVSDPLASGQDGDVAQEAMPLILGDYVSVEIEGRDVENAVRVPLRWMRDGGVLWIKDGQKLRVAPVSIAYEDREYAYITAGVEAGDNIVTSAIPVPVPGMTIRTMEEARAAVQGKMKGPKGPEKKAHE